MRSQIRIRQLSKLMQLVKRQDAQSPTQIKIFQACNNIIYIL